MNRRTRYRIIGSCLGQQPRKRKFHSHSCHILHPEELLLSWNSLLIPPFSIKKKISWPFSYQQKSLLSCCYSLLPLFQQAMSALALFGGSGTSSGLVVSLPSAFQQVARIPALFHWALGENTARRAGEAAERRKSAL